MAERLGLRWRTDIDRLQASPAKADGWGAFTLGVADTTPLEMANAYATVAADGRYCEPLPVLSRSRGRTAAAVGTRASTVAAPRCQQAVAPEVARGGDGRGPLRHRVRRGDAAAAAAGRPRPACTAMVGRPVAGKTGTTDDTRAAWFVGFTPGLAAAAFIADPDNPFHAVGDCDRVKPIESVA